MMCIGAIPKIGPHKYPTQTHHHPRKQLRYNRAREISRRLNWLNKREILAIQIYPPPSTINLPRKTKMFSTTYRLN